MKRDAPPPIEVQNAQRSVVVSAPSLQPFAEIAIALAWERRRRGSDIAGVKTVLVSIVSDRTMAQLHRRFCGVADPTDVLTFQHGEIVISAQTAARQARIFRTSLKRELRLYILHGLLHLCGYDDGTERDRATMKRIQETLLRIAERSHVP